MARKSVLLTIYFFVAYSFCRAGNIDSNVSNQVRMYIGKAWSSNTNDSSLFYFDEALKVAKRMHWHEGQGIVLGNMGAHAFELQNNYTRSLSLLLKSLEISQQYTDTSQIAYVLTRLSTVYNAVDDYHNALSYGRSAYAFGKASKDQTMIWLSAYNLGLAYGNLNVTDSSLLLFQECYQVSNSIDDEAKDFQMSIAMRGLAYAHLLLGNDQIALAYLNKSIVLASSLDNDFLDAEIYKTFSDTYLKTRNYDSATFYSIKSLTAASKVPISKMILLNYKQLARLYEDRNNDSAVKYYKLSSIISDSIFSDKNKLELSNITLGEHERQREIAERKAAAAKERLINIQLASIGLGIITFLILFLLLSQSIIVRSGLIRFLGIVALLLVFEFINLFIHPFLGEFFHHSPVWMFMTMVCIAALLVPAHHKLEKWFTHQLVEKNRRVRLKAARKTIARLEP